MFSHPPPMSVSLPVNMKKRVFRASWRKERCSSSVLSTEVLSVNVQWSFWQPPLEQCENLWIKSPFLAERHALSLQLEGGNTEQ